MSVPALCLVLILSSGAGWATAGETSRRLAAKRDAATRALNMASPAYRAAEAPAVVDQAPSIALTADQAPPADAAPTAALSGGPPKLREPTGRWYLFAAVRGRSYGVDFLQDEAGEPYRAFSAGRMAQVGDAQIGLAWRSGPHQTAIGLLVRRQRYRDPFLDLVAPRRDEVIAVTYSLRPEPPKREPVTSSGSE